MKEEEDQPSTSATQSSPAPGQSKKKSKFLRLWVRGGTGKTQDFSRVRLGFLGLGIELSCDFIKLGTLGLVFIITNVGEGIFFPLSVFASSSCWVANNFSEFFRTEIIK